MQVVHGLAKFQEYIAFRVLLCSRKTIVVCSPGTQRSTNTISLPTMESREETQALLDSPVTTPPANTVQNLENPPNSNKLAIGVIATCIALSTVFSVLRVYSRVFCARKVRLEDCKNHQLPRLSQ